MIDYANPKEWGPHFWFMMRSIANTYPDNPSSGERRHTKIFFTELKYILPCALCREHYSATIKKYDIKNYLLDRSSLCRWVELVYTYIEAHKNDKVPSEKVLKKSSKKQKENKENTRIVHRSKRAINKTPKCKTCGQF